MDEVGDLENLSTSEIREVFLSQLSADSEYRERLDYHFDVIFETYYHLAAYCYSVNNGRLLRWLFNYFFGANTVEARKAGVLDGIWGINTRILDDVMEGDGCEKPENPEEFWNKYRKSLEGHEVESESEVENLAFWSAHSLAEELDEETTEEFIEDLSNITNVCLKQDKSNLEEYKEYVRAVAKLGKLTVLSTSPVEGRGISEGSLNIGYEVAIVTQIADDLHDGDTPLDDEKLVQYAKKQRKDFKTLTGRIFGVILSGGYGNLSKLLFKLSKSDSKKYGV